MPWGTIGKLPEGFPGGDRSGRKTSMKLTKDTVAALKLDGKTDAIFFDDEVAGFGVRLRLGADGKVAKSYVAQRRHRPAHRPPYPRRTQPARGRAAFRAPDRDHRQSQPRMAAIALAPDTGGRAM